MREAYSKTPEWNAWYNMVRRCTYAKHPSYKHYGARGIVVCQRWLESYHNFLADVGPKPGPEYSLDRYPDNDGNYEPENVRWRYHIDNSNNRRNNRKLSLNGETRTVSEWARIQGVPRSRLEKRVQMGWDDERILTEPARGGIKS